MSPKLPRDVDGLRLVRVLCSRFGYVEKNQVGSHHTLELTATRAHLVIPEHKSLRVGTLSAILARFEDQTGRSREEILRVL